MCNCFVELYYVMLVCRTPAHDRSGGCAGASGGDRQKPALHCGISLSHRCQSKQVEAGAGGMPRIRRHVVDIHGLLFLSQGCSGEVFSHRGLPSNGIGIGSRGSGILRPGIYSG